MKRPYAYLAPTIIYYNRLLSRYARMITRNEQIVPDMVEKVLEDQFETDELRASRHLREQLKITLRDLCLNWLLQHDAASFKGRYITDNDIEKPSALN